MVTRKIKIDPFNVDTMLINEAARIIKGGGLVSFPTETVYGLGANAFDEKAVRAIFTAKGRPADNPLIAHVASIEGALSLTRDVPKPAIMLMEHFWGGPLTLILHSAGRLPSVVTGGLDTVAVRMPSHPVALSLIEAAGVPIAAPSANISGRPSPTAADDVLADFDGRIDAVIDGGMTDIGIESTVLDMTAPVPTILRPGAVSLEQLLEVLDECVTDDKGASPKSPGTKYRHYAPKAKIISVSGDGAAAFIKREAEKAEGRVAIIAPEGFDFGAHIPLASGKNAMDYAARLYFLLREADRKGADIVFALEPDPKGIGAAVINRLRKAAGQNVVIA